MIKFTYQPTTNSSIINTPRASNSTILPPLQTRLISTARLPSTQNQIHDMIQTLLPMLHLRKNSRASLPHLRRIALHNTQISAHNIRKINLVHNQKIRPGDTGSTLSRHLVSASYIDNVDDEIRQLTRVVRCEVVASGLDQEEISLELLLERLQGEKVGADIFTDGSVGAAACFDCADSRRGEGFVPR